MERTIDETMVVPLGRAAKYGTLEVNITKLPAEVFGHLFAYGVRQNINDAIADKTDDEDKPLSIEAIREKAIKRLASLYAGELRARNGEPAEPIDPIEAEMHRMAKAAIAKQIKETDEYKNAPKGTKNRTLFAINARSQKRGDGDIGLEGAIAKYIAASPKLKGIATRRVREAEDAAGAVEL
jgi:hypothetical protein